MGNTKHEDKATQTLRWLTEIAHQAVQTESQTESQTKSQVEMQTKVRTEGPDINTLFITGSGRKINVDATSFQKTDDLFSQKEKLGME